MRAFICPPHPLAVGLPWCLPLARSSPEASGPCRAHAGPLWRGGPPPGGRCCRRVVSDSTSLPCLEATSLLHTRTSHGCGRCCPTGPVQALSGVPCPSGPPAGSAHPRRAAGGLTSGSSATLNVRLQNSFIPVSSLWRVSEVRLTLQTWDAKPALGLSLLRFQRAVLPWRVAVSTSMGTAWAGRVRVGAGTPCYSWWARRSQPRGHRSLAGQGFSCISSFPGKRSPAERSWRMDKVLAFFTLVKLSFQNRVAPGESWAILGHGRIQGGPGVGILCFRGRTGLNRL